MNQIKRITRAEDFPGTDPHRVTAGNAYWMNDHPVYFDFFDRDKVGSSMAWRTRMTRSSMP